MKAEKWMVDVSPPQIFLTVFSGHNAAQQLVIDLAEAFHLKISQINLANDGEWLNPGYFQPNYFDASEPPTLPRDYLAIRIEGRGPKEFKGIAISIENSVGSNMVCCEFSGKAEFEDAEFARKLTKVLDGVNAQFASLAVENESLEPSQGADCYRFYLGPEVAPRFDADSMGSKSLCRGRGGFYASPDGKVATKISAWLKVHFTSTD